MPRINTQARFYRSVKSTDTSADRYITFGSHATYQLNTGGISIWARRGTWRADGENIVELIQFGTSYVRVAYTGSVVTVTAYANAATIASTSYTLPSSNMSSWHNIVVTWDSSSMIVYFDRTAIITLSGDKRLSFSGNPSFYVGAGNAAGSGYFFDGWHTRAALYNAKLSVSDIEKIWLTESPSSEVAAWDYTDVSGSTITLTRGSGNNGTIISGSIVNEVPCIPRVKSRNIPSSLGLTTGRVESASNCGISGSGAWTMGGWIFINKINGGGSGYDFPFATMGATAPYLGLDNGVFSIGHTASINSSTIKAQQYLGQWVHLAGSYSGGTNGTYKIFLNGKQVYSTTYVGTPALVNGKFAINNYLNSGLYQLYAQFSQVFCATSALTETEIYNLAYNLSTPTLAVMWALDDTLSTSATDSSGNSNTGTITSGSWALNSPLKIKAKARDIAGSVKNTTSSGYSVSAASASYALTSGCFSTKVKVDPVQTATGGQPRFLQLSGGGVVIEIYQSAANVVQMYVFSTSPSVSQSATSSGTIAAPLFDGNWHTLTGHWSSAGIKLYLDGTLIATNTNNCQVGYSGNPALYIGNYGASTYGLMGYQTEVQIGSAIPTAQEVLNVHYLGSDLPSCVSRWDINLLDSTTITDSKGVATQTLTTATKSIISPSKGRLSPRSFPYSLQFVRGSSTRSTIPYVNLGSNLSYTAWIQPRLNGNTGDIVGIMDTLIRISPTDIKFYTDGTLGYLASATFAFEHNKLYHLGVTCSGTTVKFYINGNLIATKTASGAIDTTNTSNYLGFYAIAPSVFEGEMAEVTAYSRVLTDAEIAAMYFQNVVPTTNLERYYKLATGSGTTATDSSANAQNGTITAGTWQRGFFATRTQIT